MFLVDLNPGYVLSVKAVSNNNRCPGNCKVKPMENRRSDVFYGVRPAAEIKGICIRQERHGSAFFYFLDNLPHVHGADEPIISQLPEMQFYCGLVPRSKPGGKPGSIEQFPDL